MRKGLPGMHRLTLFFLLWSPFCGLGSYLCLQYRKVFLQEQRLYSPRQLADHFFHGENDTQIVHTPCNFCHKYLFDSGRVESVRSGVDFIFIDVLIIVRLSFARSLSLCEHIWQILCTNTSTRTMKRVSSAAVKAPSTNTTRIMSPW